MKFCTNCGGAMADNVEICPKCGTHAPVQNQEASTNESAAASSSEQSTNAAPNQNNQESNPVQFQAQPTYQGQQMNGNYQGMPQMGQPMYAYDPTDHTSQMDAEDIRENKVYAVGVYVLGWFGIVIGALAAKDSRFVKFHMDEMMRLLILQILVGIVTLVLCWTIIVPIAAGVFSLVLFVIRIIGFVNACSGKAKEMPMIHAFKFVG